MRKACLVAMIATLCGGSVLAHSALAQSAPGPSATGQARPAPRSNGVPLDRGPFTPEASSAYQGGGMILQGAPGAPPPMAEPTPPGQTPRNMVPPR
jgi:hypothetical protein